MPHFQLIAIDGEILGLVKLQGHHWAAGHLIHRGIAEGNLRVVDRVDSDHPETYSILVVEKA